MNIILEHIGRRFNRDWVFHKLDYHFMARQSYAILGPNGSGKSTLLQVIASSLTPSAGRISHTAEGRAIEPDHIYRFISICAPYMELIEEFTLAEQIRFHFTHKNYLQGYDEQSVIALLGLHKARDRQIRYFSSGMKQRVKLALACCADVPLLLLDEPTTNLDKEGFDWYLKLIDRTKDTRLVIVCSNQEKEYAFCDRFIHITDYKT